LCALRARSACGDTSLQRSPTSVLMRDLFVHVTLTLGVR
jgi:hypothetical protein